ncbi:hypothetical protein J3B02_000594 [Coemansia erecta]|uniref:Very-long-chain (3R)-3-hydroxyacyl-CoA dehydratase n=1 Tax=Coemansia asiatica TaxID=1052880 RepID=A0A9W7XH67_9FUNG|nr:hypothetical protein LPJ64_003847 [Coemansia asiatica]KAJ2858016.1 hypothetical protein J3B02_000594 [Coemansia erecta]KAJ2880413.1 hypothetical protein FB639_002838 [Coemansia asiatica]
MAQKKTSSIVDAYLVAYNAASFIGWAYVLIQTTLYLSEHGTNLDGLFARVGYPLIYVQTGATLEIIHSLIGFVRSSPMTVLMQVYSRLLLVWGTLYMFDYPEVRASNALVLMIFAWSITECVRYSHYALSLVGIEVYPLLYLRYTLFYVLYPMGVTGELLEMWAALPHAAAIRPALKGFFLLNMVNYPPVLYKLYTHMIRQRRKVLGCEGSKAKTQGAESAESAVSKKKKL